MALTDTQYDIIVSMSKRLDLLGKRFGRLTVLDFGFIRSQRTYWICLCSCGQKTTVAGKLLNSGHTSSCGCLHREKFTNLRHGLQGTRFYRIWTNIKSRCKNKNLNQYKDYGGRGIKCLWNSFEEFRDEMYQSYLGHVKEYGEKDTFIDRIDNNGSYSKRNCRWSTRSLNNNNKRNHFFIEFNGESKNVSQWAKETGIPRGTLKHRYLRGVRGVKLFSKDNLRWL